MPNLYCPVEVSFIAHPRIKMLSLQLSITESNARGCLVTLWLWAMLNRPNGNLGKIHPEELAVLLDWKNDPIDLVSALVENRWLEASEEGFNIPNWHEFGGKVETKRAKGRERQAKHKESKRQEKEHTVTHGNAQVTHGNACSLYIREDKRREDKRREDLNTVCEVTPVLPVAVAPASRKTKTPKPPTEGTEVWSAYRESMIKNWNMDPPRSAKTASQATQLVGLVGLEKAKELASYYPTIATRFYRLRGHPFGQLLTDYQAMLIDLNRPEIAPVIEADNEAFFKALEQQSNPVAIKTLRR